MSEQFDLTRFGYLLRNDLINRYRAIALVSATIAALVLLGILISDGDDPDRSATYGFLLFAMLFVWGPIAASRSFLELHNKELNHAYLLLPASAAEKAGARILLATVLFPLYVFLFVIALSWLVAALVALLTSVSVMTYMPGSFASPAVIGTFIVHQSLFLLGAAWFRKLHFTKTVLSLTAVLLGLMFFTVLVLRVFFGDMAAVGADLGVNPQEIAESYGGVVEAAFELAKLLYFAVLPVFCWFVVWLRIRETQVSHGV